MAENRAGDKAETGRRLTVPEAAEVIGTTSEGVRSRIKRGTLPTVKEGGRVFVILEGAPPRPDAAPPGDRAGDRAELVDELRARVASLEGQLERRAESEAELRRIIAALTQRLPELEAPGEPESATERAGSVQRVAEGAGGGVLTHVAVWAGTLAFAAFSYIVNRIDLSIVALAGVSVYMIVDSLRDIVLLRREVGRVSRWSYVVVVSGTLVLLALIALVLFQGGLFLPSA